MSQKMCDLPVPIVFKTDLKIGNTKMEKIGYLKLANSNFKKNLKNYGIGKVGNREIGKNKKRKKNFKKHEIETSKFEEKLWELWY
jgi:hypothetical protein